MMSKAETMLVPGKDQVHWSRGMYCFVDLVDFYLKITIPDVIYSILGKPIIDHFINSRRPITNITH